MKHSDPHNEMSQKIKQTLDDEELDKETRQLLTQARYRAIDGQLQPSLLKRYAGPVTAFASVCIIAIAITLSLNSNDQPSETDDIEAFEIITSNDSLEMYQNLEFYLWMDEEVKT